MMSLVPSRGALQSRAAPDERRGRDRNRLAWVLACSLCALIAAPAGAQEVAATNAPGGLVRVSGTVRVPNSCWIPGPLTAGSPPEAPEIANALPVTFRVDHTGGDMCAQVMTEHAFEGEFGNPRDLHYVIVYLEVAQDGARGSLGLPDAVIATVE